MLPKYVQILFGLIGLALIVYVVLLGMAAFFDWLNPGGSSGRMARLTIGAIIGLGVAAAIVWVRKLRS
jgi:hypothetical protein